MENRKTSGSIVGGIILIAVGITLIVSFLSTAIYNIASLININGSNNDFDPSLIDGNNSGSQTMNLFIIVIMLFMAMASSVLIVIGIITLKRGVVNKEVSTKGRIGTCVIEELRWHSFRNGRRFWIVVSYQGESGQPHQYSTRISRIDYNNLKKGMTLECSILGEECYLDVNNIKVVNN